MMAGGGQSVHTGRRPIPWPSLPGDGGRGGRYDATKRPVTRVIQVRDNTKLDIATAKSNRKATRAVSWFPFPIGAHSWLKQIRRRNGLDA
jgi:hypothetical protein